MKATATTQQSTNCLRCGRTLRTAQSIARGYGPTCSTKIRHAAPAADFKPHQIDSARELIEDAAIVPVRGQVFRAVSTDGTGTYLTHPTNCTCPGGLKGRNCYHMAAVRLLLAA